jgi:DNA-binding PadR family transcriptional regulator
VPADVSSIPPHWFQILLALADRDLHGLAITREVFERTEGRTQLWPGMLYGALRKLTDAGLVIDADAPAGFTSGGGRPRHYRLTPLGRRVCADEAERLARIVDAARSKRLIGPARGPSRRPRTA